MTMMKRIFAGGAAVAALAVTAPASAQYAYPHAYANPYGYANPYSRNMTAIATQQCTAAVQQRLVTRTGLTGVIGSLLGAYATTPRVLGVTQVNPRRTTIRVSGVASSGRFAYSPYGIGAYGALGAGYQPDLRFRCDVDYRGFVRNVRIDRLR